MSKIIIGLIEEVKIKGCSILSRVDTGARRCSIDRVLARNLNLGPILGEKKYRSAHGKSARVVVEEDIILKGEKLHVLINLADRSNMKYAFLIGREALKEGDFLIEPNKKFKKIKK